MPVCDRPCAVCAGFGVRRVESAGIVGQGLSQGHNKGQRGATTDVSKQVCVCYPCCVFLTFAYIHSFALLTLLRSTTYSVQPIAATTA